jgi:predicted transporter
MFYDLYLFLLLAIKIVFIVSVVQNRLTPSPALKERIETFGNYFKFGAALLMMYLFTPRITRSPVMIDQKTKIYLFIFAVLTVVDLFKDEYKENKGKK